MRDPADNYGRGFLTEEEADSYIAHIEATTFPPLPVRRPVVCTDPSCDCVWTDDERSE